MQNAYLDTSSDGQRNFLFGQKGDILFSEQVVSQGGSENKPDQVASPATMSHTSRNPYFKSLSTTPVQNKRPVAKNTKGISNSFSTARKGTQKSNIILEKSFTRKNFVQNIKRLVKKIPEENEGRHLPIVRNIKKRDSLLLKGQSDEMNASFNQDRSSVYRKAYDNLSGYTSKGSSPGRQPTDSPTTQK